MTAPSKRNPTPGRHIYDVIIFGGQLAGVLTTALLARHGLHVLLVPHDGLSAPYVHDDWKLPHAPFVMPPLKTMPLLEEQLVSLGVATDVQRVLKTPPLQFIESKRRFERSPDEATRIREFARALGPHAKAFEVNWQQAIGFSTESDAFFKEHPDFPPEGVLASWRMKRAIAREADNLERDTPLKLDSPLRKLLPWIVPVENPSELTRARLLGRVLTAPTILPGNYEWLLTFLQERTRELGADVLPADETVAFIAFEGSKATGICLSRNDTIYRAPTMVAACDFDVFLKLLPKGVHKFGKTLLRRMTPKKALLTFNVVLPEKALPRGLGELALVYGESFEGGCALLQVSPARTAAGAEVPDYRVLTVAMPAQRNLRMSGALTVQAMIEGMWAGLDDVLPFVRRHTVLESSPWLHAPAVLEHLGEPWPFFQLPDDSWLGVSGLTTSSAWKQLLIANRQVLPGLGIEGETMAALQVVKRITATLRRDSPLKARKSA